MTNHPNRSSKSVAIRQASTYVSISGRGTSWTIYAPYRDTEPDGPRTEISCDSFWKAKAQAAAIKAHIALALMARHTDDADTAIEWAHYNGDNDTRSLVDAGLAA